MRKKKKNSSVVIFAGSESDTQYLSAHEVNSNMCILHNAN